MKNKIIPIGFIALLAISIFAGLVTVGNATAMLVHIDSDEDSVYLYNTTSGEIKTFKDLTSALKEAKKGDTLIFQDCYEGSFNVPAGVTLSGRFYKPAAEIVAKGIGVTLNSGSVLENCVVWGGNVGVSVKDASNFRIRGVRVLGAKEKCIRVSGSEGKIVMTTIGSTPGMGIYSDNSTLEVLGCDITDCGDDGIGFSKKNKTVIEIIGNTFKGCSDGIDIEGSVATMECNRFYSNTDEAIDLDGDCNVTIAYNMMYDNGDDGIEIRLLNSSRSYIHDNIIDGCGEDGIEIISSPVEEVSNEVRIEDNIVRNTVRYGVGWVDVNTEEFNPKLKFPIFLTRNVFENCGRGEYPQKD